MAQDRSQHSLTRQARSPLSGRIVPDRRRHAVQYPLDNPQAACPGPQWVDPVDLARPAPAENSSGVHAAGVAYATAKLAILYYAQELQPRVGDGYRRVCVRTRLHARHRAVPGAGPGHSGDVAGCGAFPRMASPSRSAPTLASIVLEDRRTRLRDGTFVVIDKETELAPFAHDRDRELRLWEATVDLLEKAALADS